MLKSGVSYNVYMKRVWIFDETLSPGVFHILLHLSLPRRQLCVFLYVLALFCFRVSELPRLCQQSSGKSEPTRDSGDKRGRGKLSFPPLTIPFLSSSAWPKCCSRSSYSLTWKERVPHTCKKTQSCLRSRLINYI